jgi:hypothetical protein
MNSTTLDLDNGIYADGALPTAADSSYASKFYAYKSFGWKGSVTGLAQARGESIVSLYANEVKNKTKLLMDTMEFLAFYDATFGLDTLITTNVIDAGGGAITKQLIDRAAVRVQMKGGYITDIYSSLRVKADINDLYNSTNQVILNMPGTDSLTLGQTVAQANTVAGLANIKGDFFLNPGNTYALPNGSSSSPLGATTSTVYLLNMDYISYKFLQRPVVEELGRTADKREFFVKAYAALKLTAEPWCAKITNVKDNTLT